MREHQRIMRTTLDIDDDVLRAAKELARRERLSAGQVVSRLLRQAMLGSKPTDAAAPTGIAGFRPFQSSRTAAQLVTNEQVDAIRDQHGI
jgi:hypothetical protein